MVAEDDAVDVCVLEGDVTSQFRNVPARRLSIMLLRLDAKRVQLPAEFSTTWTEPNLHFVLKVRVGNCVISSTA